MPEDDFFTKLRLMETFLIFVAFAIIFSMLRSLADVPVDMFYAVVACVVFFIGNLVKLMIEEFDLL